MRQLVERQPAQEPAPVVQVESIVAKQITTEHLNAPVKEE
jgi:hypothetical protein